MKKQKITVALTGNPNAGKTSVFNELTGARQHVGNYPGVTVDYKEADIEVGGAQVNVVDLPGTYSLTAYSPEELVARNYIIEQKPDVVISVVDASNLERNLYLVVQLLELGVPLVICLNMIDAAKQRGMTVDHEKLSHLLGAPVVPCIARAGQGMQELISAAVELAKTKPKWKPLNITYGSDVDEGLVELSALLEDEAKRHAPITSRWLALKCLEGDSEIFDKLSRDKDLFSKLTSVCDKLGKHIRSTLDDEPESIVADHRYGHLTGVSRQVLHQEREVRIDFTDKVDQLLTHRLIGPMVLMGIIYFVYQFVFWASEKPMQWVEAAFGLCGQGVSAVLPDGLLKSLLVSGVIDGVGGVLGFVPLIMCMFLAIAILDDSGYMARMAYLMDRVLRSFGLHGNSVMSLIIGGGISGGCAVPGVMATRTLKDPMARMATILVVPFMNCGAKMPVYMLLIGAFFAARKAEMMFLLTIVSWALALIASKILRSTILKGEQSPFVMELPPYRTPTIKGLTIHTWERSWHYIKKAGTVLLGISILMWGAMTFPVLPENKVAEFQARIETAPTQEAQAAARAELAQAKLANTFAGRGGQALTAITSPLGFDWRTNVALIGGFAAKEVIVSTMATAFSLEASDKQESHELSKLLASSSDWNPLKAFALMIIVMVYSPCMATIAMIMRETKSWRWAAFSTIYNTALAYVLALVVYQGGQLLGLG